MMEGLYNIKCTVSYDGGNYGGYQLQDNAETIQQRLENALEKIVKKHTRTYASGRTDAGVHARGQVFHFLTETPIPEDKWAFAFNALLPDDIVVLTAQYVPHSFHSRFSAVEKVYRYCLWNRRVDDVFSRHYSWHIPYALDLDAMREAASYLIGEHDFTSFCSIRSAAGNKIRNIYEITIDEEEPGKIWLTFRGNGFLYNMVRIIVGTLVNVGAKKRIPRSIRDILAEKNRDLAGKTAPAKGLFLWEVKY